MVSVPAQDPPYTTSLYAVRFAAVMEGIMLMMAIFRSLYKYDVG